VSFAVPGSSHGVGAAVWAAGGGGCETSYGGRAPPDAVPCGANGAEGQGARGEGRHGRVTQGNIQNVAIYRVGVLWLQTCSGARLVACVRFSECWAVRSYEKSQNFKEFG